MFSEAKKRELFSQRIKDNEWKPLLDILCDLDRKSQFCVRKCGTNAKYMIKYSFLFDSWERFSTEMRGIGYVEDITKDGNKWEVCLTPIPDELMSRNH